MEISGITGEGFVCTPTDTQLWRAGLHSGLGADLGGFGLAWTRTRVVTAARDGGEHHGCRQ